MDTFFTIKAWIKVIAAYLTLIIWFVLVYVVYRIFKMMRKEDYILRHSLDKPKTPQEAKNMYMDDWQQIKDFANSLQESEWKLAVIQADKLVDEVLRTKGYQGESMGERLMGISPNRFTTLQEVWEAHKLRNLLVHDINHSITKRQAVAAIESYERFLTELGFFI